MSKGVKKSNRSGQGFIQSSASGVNTGVIKKSKATHDHHYEFEENVKRTKTWIEEAWKLLKENINSEGKTKEDLHEQLNRLRQLNVSHEEGQSFLHAAVDWAERPVETLDLMEKIKSITH